MPRKTIYKVILTVAGILLGGLAGFMYFVNYGGNNCDMNGSCDCFCCDFLNSRGYEACGMFGLLAGVTLGLLVTYLIQKKLIK